MRYLLQLITIAILTVAATSAFAGDSPLLTVRWDGALAEKIGAAQAGGAPLEASHADQATGREAAIDKLAQVSEKVRACQDFKIGWSESSARKLFRAMRYHDADLSSVDLQPWVDVSVTSRRGLQPFSVHPQNSGRAAGVVPLDPTWTFTYVVAQTETGPVVASQKWPTPQELDDGATCRPISSRIEFPAGKAVDVAIEPFRMWGMRVAKSLGGDTIDRPTYDALVGVIRSTDGASASR